MPAVAACSRVEGDTQDTVPVAAHPTGKKVCPQVTLLCVHTGVPLQWRGGGDMGCAQKGWCVPVDELFLSMGVVHAGQAADGGGGGCRKGELGT